MSYRIERCTASREEQEELAQFLASFIRDGEGPTGDPREQTAELWLTRMRGWWDWNPFCHEDSPRGLLVRTDEDQIVGFFGFIPHDYVENGTRVRGLISTTSYVREAHRGAALPLFMKAHRLESDFHYVDGAPNEAIYPILERFGYEHKESARMHLYPLSASLANPMRWATGVAHLFTGPKGEIPESGRIITDPAEASSCAAFPDPQLRRAVSLESLSWYLKSGTGPHFFIGWCDGNGVLQCYLLGFIRSKSVVKALVIADYAFADAEAKNILELLISQVTSRPSEFLVPESVSLVVWPTCDDELQTKTPFQKSFDPRLFYRLPKAASEKPRHILPFEGDHIFQ